MKRETETCGGGLAATCWNSSVDGFCTAARSHEASGSSSVTSPVHMPRIAPGSFSRPSMVTLTRSPSRSPVLGVTSTVTPVTSPSVRTASSSFAGVVVVVEASASTVTCGAVQSRPPHRTPIPAIATETTAPSAISRRLRRRLATRPLSSSGVGWSGNGRSPRARRRVSRSVIVRLHRSQGPGWERLRTRRKARPSGLVPGAGSPRRCRQ